MMKALNVLSDRSAEQVVGVELGAGDQQVPLGLLLAYRCMLGADTQRGLIATHRVGQGDQRLDPLVYLLEQPGRAVDHAVDEPDRGGGAGQRFQQRDHPVRGDEVHDHQVANAARFGPYPTGPDRAPSGRTALWRRPQPHSTSCWSYWVTATATCGISYCW